MLNSKSKNIKKQRKAFGNPNLLLAHLGKSQTVHEQTFDPTAYSHYDNINRGKKIEEITLHSKPCIPSVLSLMHKAKTVNIYDNNSWH